MRDACPAAVGPGPQPLLTPGPPAGPGLSGGSGRLPPRAPAQLHPAGPPTPHRRGGTGHRGLAPDHHEALHGGHDGENEHDPEHGDEEPGEGQAHPDGEDPLAPLHEAPLGREAQAPGPGPLIGDEGGGGQDGQGQHRGVATESKKAPRGEAVPAALATAPSSRSGREAAMSRARPSPRRPAPTATAVATASTKPATVRWSAVAPMRRMAWPTGCVPRSRLLRQRASNNGRFLRVEG